MKLASSSSPSFKSPSFFICRNEFFIVSIIFLVQRCGIGPFYNIISDCDEVLNYWEPVHFLASMPFGLTSLPVGHKRTRDSQAAQSVNASRNMLPTEKDAKQHDHNMHASHTHVHNMHVLGMHGQPTDLRAKNRHQAMIHNIDDVNPHLMMREINSSKFVSPSLTRSMQTWEYSPEFALRSYVYILFHCIVVWISKVFSRLLFMDSSVFQLIRIPESVSMFFVTRGFLSLLAALSELNFAQSIQCIFGKRIAILYLLVNLLSPGTFLASSQMLPSTTFMWISLWSWSYFFKHQIYLSLLLALIGTLTCWPFAGLIYIPLTLVSLAHYGITLSGLKTVLQSVLIVLALVVGVDSFYYGKLVIAPMNIVLYNIGFTGAGGGGGKSVLYGVESWTFYVRNLLLNFHLFLILSAVGLLIMSLNLLKRQSTPDGATPTTIGAGIKDSIVVVGTPIPLWVGLMSLVPHKEERFLTPIYPLICLSSAMALSWLMTGRIDETIDSMTDVDGIRKKHDDWKTETTQVTATSVSNQRMTHPSPTRFGILSILDFYRFKQEPSSSLHPLPQTHRAERISAIPKLLYRILGFTFWVLSFFFAASRILALYHYYWKPILYIWTMTERLPYTIPLAESPMETTVLPMSICTGKEWYRYPSSFFLPPGSRLGFVKSNFTGLLPGIFEDTRLVLEDMNDGNREEPKHYTPLTACDYLIDSSDALDHYMPGPSVLRRNDASLPDSPHVTDNIIEIASNTIQRRIQVIACHALLDASQSRFPYRAFFLGSSFFSSRGRSYTQYCLWKLSSH